MRTASPLHTLFYRGYLLNSDNSFRGAREFHCFDDDEAKQRAMAWLALTENDGAVGMELWERDQRIFIHQRGIIVTRGSTD
jgi:hypothetical protein